MEVRDYIGGGCKPVHGVGRKAYTDRAWITKLKGLPAWST